MAEDDQIVQHPARITVASVSPKTLWASMSRDDARWAMDMHPLLCGMLFQLPAETGYPHADGYQWEPWSQQEKDSWLRMLTKCLDILYPVRTEPDKEGEPALVVVVNETETVPVYALPDPDPPVAGEVISQNGAVNPLDLKLKVIELSRSTNDPEEILGYDLSPVSAKKNREAREWSPEYLAQVAGVHRNAVHRLEDGGLPQDWQILRIASAFRLTEPEEVSA